MKKLFLLAWPIALAAVSCSNEEVVSVNNDANEIKFAVTAENATRAADAFCNAFMPGDFDVWARVNDLEYFANVHYTRDGETSSTYKAEGGKVHFWPTTGTDVKFWAAKNHNVGGTFNWTSDGTSSPTIEFEPAKTASAQHDLLYAYTIQSRPDYNKNGVVEMNFRHALSQIVFKAKVSNPTIKVQIDRVEVCRIKGKGTFTYPTTVTDQNWETHANADKTNDENRYWDNYTVTDADFDTEKFTTAVTIAYNETKNLTEETRTEDGHKTTRDFKHSLLLLPQETAAWSHTAGTTGTGVDTPVSPATTATGAYFLVHCKIWNVSESDNELLLWGSDAATEAVAIPVAINWLPGRKYIYTFNFGSKTTGGFVPGTGEDVLIPISFDVTVDDFVNVTDTPVWMGPDETPKP